MKKVSDRALARLPGRYEDLTALFPPHAIQDEADYDATLEVLEALLRLRRPTRAQAQYLDTLTQLVHAYDEAHYAEELVELTPVQILEGILEEHDWTASDLGRLLGNRALGSKILRGERALSKAHIRTLAEHFQVEPGLFL